MTYIVLVFLGATSYGILSTIVKFAYGDGYSLGDVVGIQLLVGFLITSGFTFYIKMRRKIKIRGKSSLVSSVDEHDKQYVAPTWKQRGILMAAGLPMVVTSFSYYGALQYISASLAIILLFQFTWISVLIQMIHRRQRPHKIILLTLFILFGGTLLAAGIAEQGVGHFHWWGITMGLISAVSYSLFIFFNGQVVTTVYPMYRTQWMLTGALLVAFLIYPPSFLVDGRLWEGLLFYGCLLGFFGSFIPPVLFAIGVPQIGGAMAGILGAVELPVAMIASAWILCEQVSLLQWTGVICILAGVALPEGYRQLRVRRMLRN